MTDLKQQSIIMSTDKSSAREHVRVGVFIPKNSQMLDLACIDIMGTMSYEYMYDVRDIVPAPLIDLAPSVSIKYISTVQPGEPIPLTAGASLRCTHHLSDPEVQPGKLDIILVPGPDPTLSFDEPEITNWLAAHAARTADTDILSVCTGIFVCGAAGLLKGKRVCGPRGMQSMLQAKFAAPKLAPSAWVGDELRWVQDGNFWSSGGVTSGNDLVAAYVRHSPKFPGPVVEVGLKLTEVADRPQRYETGKAAYNLSFAWQLLKAVVLGMVKGKPKTA